VAGTPRAVEAHAVGRTQRHEDRPHADDWHVQDLTGAADNSTRAQSSDVSIGGERVDSIQFAGKLDTTQQPREDNVARTGGATREADLPSSSDVCAGRPDGEDCGNNAESKSRKVPGKCKSIKLGEGIMVGKCLPTDMFACAGKAIGSTCKLFDTCPPGTRAPCFGTCSRRANSSEQDVYDTCVVMAPAMGVCVGRKRGDDCGNDAEVDGRAVSGKCMIKQLPGFHVTEQCLPADFFSCDGQELGSMCTMNDLCPKSATVPCSGKCVMVIDPSSDFKVYCNVKVAGQSGAPRLSGGDVLGKAAAEQKTTSGDAAGATNDGSSGRNGARAAHCSRAASLLVLAPLVCASP